MVALALAVYLADLSLCCPLLLTQMVAGFADCRMTRVCTYQALRLRSIRWARNPLLEPNNVRHPFRISVPRSVLHVDVLPCLLRVFSHKGRRHGSVAHSMAYRSHQLAQHTRRDTRVASATLSATPDDVRAES